MKTLAWLVLLVWVSGGVFTAAADYLHEDREPTALEQAAFTRLRQQFPGDILDANLETFRRLAKSPEYLAFLAEAYPDAAPVKAFETIVDFEKIINRILPPKERYLSSYWEQLGVDSVNEITAAEHFLVHFEVTGLGCTELGMRAASYGTLSVPGSSFFPRARGRDSWQHLRRERCWNAASAFPQLLG